MNKKNLILIVSVFMMLGGVVIWHSTFFHVPTSKTVTSNDSAFNSSSKMKSQQVAANLIEVFYLPHPPVDPIRQKVKEIIQKFPNYQLKEYDFEQEDNQQKIANYGLKGHIPVAIFIGGVNSFTIDGRTITFKNFPKGDAFVPTLEGSWDYNDLEKVLANPDQYKND